MTTARARRVEVPQEIQAGGKFADADYAWAFELPVPDARSRTPEEWARAAFEGAPAFQRGFLTFGWKVGLGLKMGPKTGPKHILGWHIRHSDPDRLTFEADSRIVDTQNVVLDDDSTVTWITFVRYNNVLGRVLWALAAPVHQVLTPFSLKRASRSRARA